MQKYKIKFRNIIIVLVIGFTFFPLTAWAAKLFLAPTVGSYYLGDSFVAEIRIDTEGEAINALKANLIFPDILEVVGLEKENSILNLWVGEPFYLNERGLISFIGGLPHPGYQGKDGLIGSVTFRVKGEGKAKVIFQDDSQVLLNDGQGTEATLETKGATYHLISIKKNLLYYLLAVALLLIILLIIIIWKSRRKKAILNL